MVVTVGLQELVLCNDYFEFQLPFQVYIQINMKYILCQRRRIYAGKIRYIYKHVKSKKNGKLAKKRYYGSCFFGIKTKNISNRHKNVFFDLKTVVDKKRVYLGMISARYNTNRQSFKKVTSPIEGRG